MPIPAWLGAGALTLAGTLATNASNAAQARRQMQFQERMSGSAHQRGVADLQAAGLNPMLSVGGAGASSPVGAQARMENAVGQGVNSAMAVRRSSKELELLDAQIQERYSQAQLHNAHNFNVTSMTEPQIKELNARRGLLDVDTATKTRLLSLVAANMSAQTAERLSTAFAARSHAGEADARAILLRLQERGARNMNEAERSWWMQNIAPYLHSAKEAAGMVSSVAGPVVVGRGARALAKRIPPLRSSPF